MIEYVEDSRIDGFPIYKLEKNKLSENFVEYCKSKYKVELFMNMSHDDVLIKVIIPTFSIDNDKLYQDFLKENRYEKLKQIEEYKEDEI